MEHYSEKCLIREVEKEDLPDIHSFACCSEVCQYQAWGPNEEIDSKCFIEAAIEERTHNPRTNYHLAIASLEDQKVIGTCGIYLKANNSAEIGLTLAKSVWGKGIGTEVAEVLIQISLKDFKRSKVIATTDELNKASNALLHKVGFKKLKVIHNHMFIKGRIRNTVIYEFNKRSFRY